MGSSQPAWRLCLPASVSAGAWGLSLRLGVAPGSLGAGPSPPWGFGELSGKDVQLVRQGGGGGEANYRPSILGLLHTMPLKIK